MQATLLTSLANCWHWITWSEQHFSCDLEHAINLSLFASWYILIIFLSHEKIQKYLFGLLIVCLA